MKSPLATLALIAVCAVCTVPAPAWAATALCTVQTESGRNQNSSSGTNPTCVLKQELSEPGNKIVATAQVLATGKTKCKVSINGVVVAVDRGPRSCTAFSGDVSATASLSR